MLQKEVADKPNKTIFAYRNWGRNQRNPSYRSMPRVVEFLGYIPFDMQFEGLGQKICAYRQLFGLRQKDLARQIGVEPTTIGSWERGKHKPGKKAGEKTFCLSSISNSYNITIQFF